MIDTNLTLWARAAAAPKFYAELKSVPEDFVVRERLGFAPSGAGEHVYLRIRKTRANTAWVAEQLAQFAGLRMMDVSYTGRKDRHAVTEQWFSCWLPGAQAPDWQALSLPGVEVLEVQRHDRKLRRGEHEGNDFEIRLRRLHAVAAESGAGISASAESALTARLQAIKNIGFANYFGPQRFGRDGANLSGAETLFAGGKVSRDQRSMCLSAARSYLFNDVLSAQLQSGELPPKEPLVVRVDSAGRGRAPVSPGPQGWLYGVSRRSNDALDAMAQANPRWCEALQREGLKAQQRAFWVVPENLAWRLESGPEDEQNLWLSFGLPTGSYATSLIREIVIHGEG